MWVIGHFNADLKNFESVVDSRAAAWLAHGLYYVLPNFSAFDIKQQVVYAQPVPAGYLATTALYGARLHRAPARGVGGGVLTPRLQVAMRRAADAPCSSCCCWRRRSGCRRCVSAAANCRPGTAELLYVRSPEALRRMSLSYHSLLADVYWIRAVQLYGDTKLGRTADRSYALLYPLLDLTTSLDPDFDVAYQFGALFLAERPPGGPGRPDQAIALLQKGLRAQPDDWQLHQAIGFVYYWSYQDYATAADWFRRGSRLPGAPTWLEPLAAVTLAEGGNRTASRLMWQQVLQHRQRRLVPQRGRPPPEAARRDGAAGPAHACRGDVRGPSGPAAGELGRVDARRLSPRHGRPIPPALPYRLRGGDVSLDPRSTLLPLPKEQGSRP